MVHLNSTVHLSNMAQTSNMVGADQDRDNLIILLRTTGMADIHMVRVRFNRDQVGWMRVCIMDLIMVDKRLMDDRVVYLVCSIGAVIYI
jgi:hypothetical protein